MATEAKITLSAVDKTAGAFGSIRSNLSGLGAQALSVTSALTGLSAAGALAGLVAVIRESANALDAFNDLADATGSTIENLSALEDVALRTGTSFDTVGKALVRFNVLIKDAKPGSDAEQAMAALGLQIEELRDLDPAEALLRTARALAGFADDGNKARITQELFGRTLREVAPFLKDLAERGELVATTTKAQADEAERFNRQLSAMQKNATDAARALTSELLPVLNRILGNYNSGGIAKVLGFDRTSEKMDLIGMVNDMKALDSQLTKLKNDRDKGIGYFGTPDQVAAQIEGTTIRLNEAKARFQAADAAFRGTDKLTSAAGAGRGVVNPDAVRPSLPSTLGAKPAGAESSEASEQARALAGYVNGLQNAIDKTQDLTEVEKARQFLLSQGRAGEIEQVRELVMGLAQQVDLERTAGQVLQDKRAASIAAGDAVIKANEEYQVLIRSLLDATPTAQLERQRQAMQALSEEFEAGRISAEQFNEAASAYLGLDNSPAGLDEAKRRSESLASSIEDGILKGFREGQTASEIFLSELKAQFAKTVLRPMIQPIAEAGSSLISNGLSAIAGALGLNSFDVGTDYVTHDQVALIHKGERIVPAAQNMRGGSQAVTVIQNFTVGDVATIAMVREAVAGSERRITSGLSRSVRYGGALA